MRICLLSVGTADYGAMASLRYRVLLEPVGVPQSYINPEKEANDLLIGAFEDETLVGCCILTRVGESTAQLRQMVVESNCQQKGIGTALIAFAEKTAREGGYKTLLLHARDAVMDFYKKNGYRIAGEPFVEVGIGHHKMEKQVGL